MRTTSAPPSRFSSGTYREREFCREEKSEVLGEAKLSEVFVLEMQSQRIAQVLDQLVEIERLGDDRNLETLRRVLSIAPGHGHMEMLAQGRFGTSTDRDAILRRELVGATRH